MFTFFPAVQHHRSMRFLYKESKKYIELINFGCFYNGDIRQFRCGFKYCYTHRRCIKTIRSATEKNYKKPSPVRLTSLLYIWFYFGRTILSDFVSKRNFSFSPCIISLRYKTTFDYYRRTRSANLNRKINICTNHYSLLSKLKTNKKVTRAKRPTPILSLFTLFNQFVYLLNEIESDMKNAENSHEPIHIRHVEKITRGQNGRPAHRPATHLSES